MVEKPQIPSQQPARTDSAGPSRGSAPTSADVARQAGVSRATVSYVLNNTSAVRISEPTRRRVQEAAKELGYVPHAAARSLRAGHTRIVLMPAPDVPVGTLYSGFLNEFQWALSRFDYTAVQYGSVGVGGDDAARAWAELRPVAVLAPVGMGRRGIGILQRSGAKAVITLGAEPVEGAHALIADHRAVGRVAADHLRERGHHRIGVLMPSEEGLDAFAAPRLEGVRETGAEAVGLPVAYDEESAAHVVRRAAELGLKAVFAYNDEYAMLLMRALQDAGLGIPEDVAVVGADDLMLGRLLRPRLTTVRLALPSGQELAEFVDRLVRTPTAEPQIRDVLGASLVRREST